MFNIVLGDTNNNRNPYFDFIKGLAIFCVIGIHTLSTDFNANTLMGLTTILVRNIFGAAVPLFVTLSGYFLWNKNFSQKGSYKKFMGQRFNLIYIPMLVWAFPYMIREIYFNMNAVGIFSTLILYFLGGLGFFYFITLILECYAVLPLVENVKGRAVVGLAILTIFVTGLWTCYLHFFGHELPLIVFGSLPTYIGFFALGCYLGRTKASPGIKLSVLFTIVGIVLAVAESYMWIGYHGAINGLGLKPSVTLMSFGILMLLLTPEIFNHYKPSGWTAFIEFCGRQSLPIYLSHFLVIIALDKIGFHINIWIVKILLTLFIDATIIILIKKFLPSRLSIALDVR